MAEKDAVDGATLLDALGVPDNPPAPMDTPDDGEDGLEALPAGSVSSAVSGLGDVFGGSGEPDAPSVVASPPIFRVRRALLVAMVEQVMLAVPSKDFYPAFKSIKVDVEEGLLTLTGSNSALTVVVSSLAVQVERAGSVMVPGSKFAAVIRGAEGSDVSVAVTASEVRIVSGRGSWTLRVSTTQEYPPLPDLADLVWTEVNRFAFDRAVRGARYAAGSDEQRDHFMQLEFASGSAIASDGIRYAQVNADLPMDLSVALATAGVDLVSKMLANNDAKEFRVADGPRHIVVEIGPPDAPDRAIISRLHQPFPAEARRAIAAPLGANRDQCEVGAGELLAALARAKPTGDAETGAVLLRVSPEELVVESRNRYGDSSTEVMGCRFTQLGSDRTPKSRTVTVVRDHLVKAVMAAHGVSGRSADAEEGEEPVLGDVLLLLGEDRSKSRLASVLVQDREGVAQAVLSQIRSEWLS